MKLRDEAGFSLTELLVASLIMLVVTTALFTSLEQTEVFYEDYSGDMDLRQRARVTLGQMTTEMRHTGYDLGNLDEGLNVAGATEIQFSGDMDAGEDDGACDASFEDSANGGAERIAYAFDAEAGTLTRTVDCWDGSTWSTGMHSNVVLDGLAADAIRFRYYDFDGVELSTSGGDLDANDRENVRAVSIELAISDDDAENLLGEDRVSLTMDQHVRIRNRHE